MWIRSQDKRTLVKTNDIWVDDGRVLSIDNNVTLGSYKDSKRALEVLDEIQECIEFSSEENSSYVYKMPKE
jgi:hypothetical protein